MRGALCAQHVCCFSGGEACRVGGRRSSVAQTTRHPCILAGKHGHASQAGGQKNKSLVTQPPATSANRNKESSFPPRGLLSPQQPGGGGAMFGADQTGGEGCARRCAQGESSSSPNKTNTVVSHAQHTQPPSEPAGAPPFGNQVLFVPPGPSGRLRWGGFGACGPLPPDVP